MGGIILTCQSPNCTVSMTEEQKLEAKIQSMTMNYELHNVLLFTSIIKHTVCYSRYVPDAEYSWCSGSWCSCVQCSAYNHGLESNCPGAVLWGKYCCVFQRQCNNSVQTELLEEGWDILLLQHKQSSCGPNYTLMWCAVEYETDCSSPSSSQKNMWNFISYVPLHLHVMIFIYRRNLTFTLPQGHP